MIPEKVEAIAESSTENAEAYKLYLEAKGLAISRTSENIEKAIGLINDALELDADFAEAHAELNVIYGLQSMYGNISASEAAERMEFHINRAVELAPDKPEVLTAKAWHEMNQEDADFIEATEELKKGNQTKPQLCRCLLFFVPRTD